MVDSPPNNHIHPPMKYVEKGWGYEKWIVNKKEYCGKLLFFKEGKQNFYVYTGLRHQMYALEDSELYEFSTQHFNSDSHRIVNGD